MPINNITQTISKIPPAGARGVDVQTLFVIKQEDFQDHLQGTTVTELNTLKDQLNSRIGEINSTTTIMNGYASTALTGASTATTKAEEASTSASGALTSRNQANTFATNSSNSATKSSQWADNDYNVAVETGKYSAKHWAVVAKNATSGKIDKVTSTDNAIARYNGTTGDLQNSTVTIDDNGNIGSGTQSFNGFGGSGIKNYIINGNFDIWQYKDALLTYPQTSNGYGSDDRWINASNTTKTHSQVTCTDTEMALFNASNFSRTVVTATNSTTDAVYKEQRIEDVTRLAGKTVTLSFWAKADSNKNIVVQFLQVFGTGGSPSSLVNVGNNVIALTNMWQKKTITITIPSIVGKTLGTNGVHTSYTALKFWFDSGSAVNGVLQAFQSGTFDIAQVQLEEGTVATPFENRPYWLELSLCQRYARDIGNNQLYGHIGNGFVYSATAALIEVDVEGMRAIPVILNTLTANRFELEGSARYTLSAISINASATANTNKLNLICVTTGLTAGWCVGLRNNNNTTNKIILSSEL